MARRRVVPRKSSLILPEVINPFVHELYLSFFQKCKIAVMSITIAPIRLLLMSLMLLLAWPIAAIATAGRSREDEMEPLSGWRRFAKWPMIIMGRAVFWLAGFHFIKIKGRLATSHEASLLVVSPHTSYLDLVVGFLCGIPSGVSRYENSLLPIFGSLIKFTQPIFVRRDDPDSRQHTIQAITDRAKSGGRWPHTVIFPEGTTTNGSALITFKIGAFVSGTPVQPVCIKFPNKLDTITWTWDGPGALSVLWLTLCQFHNYCEIEFLPVYTPNEKEKSDPRLFANNVKNQMARCLGVPATDHTLEDCRLMEYAKQLCLPMTSGIVEFRKLNKKLGFDFDKMKVLMDRFSSIANKHEQGHMTYHDFADHLGIPESDVLFEVFDLYDRDGSGTIDFREYLIGLSLISEPANDDATIEMAFKLFDADNKGYITEPELAQILHQAFNMNKIDVNKLFQQIDTDNNGHITYTEFKAYAELKPEYAKLFTTYHARTLEESRTNSKEILVRVSSKDDSGKSTEDCSGAKELKEKSD